MGSPPEDAINNQITGPGEVEASSGDTTTAVSVVDAGPFGVVVENIHLTGSAEDVGRRAQSICSNVRPSGEQLHTIEQDPQLGGAILRSQIFNQNQYFEVQLTPKDAKLQQHQVQADGFRRSVPFTVTREQLKVTIKELIKSFSET